LIQCIGAERCIGSRVERYGSFILVDVIIWGALLSGARMHGDIETYEISIKKLIELDPKNSGAYVLLSNVYAKLGKWKEVRI
jgi:hypothetical protein